MIQLLINHLWQSTVFAGVAGLLTLVLRKNHARTRYWIWLAASVKFLVPFFLLVSAGGRVQWTHSSPPPRQVSTAIQQISEPFQIGALARRPETPRRPLLPPVFLTVWMGGCAACLFSSCRRWRRVRAAVSAAAPIEIGAPMRTMSSPALLEPGVFGVFQPVLLLPTGIAECLTPEQLRAVVAHELCHVRRRDNLSAAIHMFVEAVFWFHPLVWWIGGRMVEERERACDEEVLAGGSDPQVYAEGILNVCKLYVESPVTCVSGVTGSDLKKRIEGIMTNRIARKIGVGRKMLLVGACAAAVGLPLSIGILNAPRLRAQSPAARAQFEVATVKLNASGSRSQLFGSRSPGVFNAENFPVRWLIAAAYHVKLFQVDGGPGWIDSARYDITAKPRVNQDRGTRLSLKDTQIEMALMVQSLLEERFQLVLHRETKELPVYALTVAKGGLKLREAPCTIYDPNNGPPRPPSGEKPPDYCGNFGIRGGGTTNRVLDAFGMTMTEFAQNLPDLGLERVVIDKTGFTGKFNVHLEFAPNETTGPGDPDRPAPTETGPSFFTAMQEQLGLKVESTKGVVEVLVIDRIEKPSEN